MIAGVVGNERAREKGEKMLIPLKRLSNFSFGGTAAIVTNMALIIGLEAAKSTRGTIIGSLLVIAIADNLSDSLSMHIYQESERRDVPGAFFITVTNFFSRLLISLTFGLIVALLPMPTVVYVGVAWGILLLSALTVILARERKVSIFPEVFKHVGMAVIVILVARLIGEWIRTHII
jgi:VIT1/CCC1 family predicted Fe2+/Mn2+ transporter